jgi:hypothetical protein
MYNHQCINIVWLDSAEIFKFQSLNQLRERKQLSVVVLTEHRSLQLLGQQVNYTQHFTELLNDAVVISVFPVDYAQ